MLVAAVLVCALLVGCSASPYSKYGRNCRDIVCLSSEECVLRHDPCDTPESRACGRYPTCQRRAPPTGQPAASCSRYRCPPGQFCTLREGRCWRPGGACPPPRPACVSSNSSALATSSPWYQ